MESPSPVRSLAAARAAAKKQDVSASRDAHAVTLAVGDAKEQHAKGSEYMKSFIWGGLDGIITTFAVVAGAGGGGLSAGTVLIMGFSSLVADALSMGVGDAMSSRAEVEVSIREREREKWELENYPEGEIKEMVEVYTGRGMTAEDAQSVIETMSKYPSFFVDQMLKDELGMDPPESAGCQEHIKAGAVCFSAFIVNGLVPLLSYVLFMPVTNNEGTLFGISCGLTALMLFILGCFKSRFTTKAWWHSGFEVLLLGSITAACAYLIAWLVHDVLSAMDV